MMNTHDMTLTMVSASVIGVPRSISSDGPKLSITRYAPLRNIQMAPARHAIPISDRVRGRPSAFIGAGAPGGGR